MTHLYWHSYHFYKWLLVLSIRRYLLGCIKIVYLSSSSVRSLWPVQCVPFQEYPCWHVQLNPPGILVHFASVWQVWVISWHSLTSGMTKSKRFELNEFLRYLHKLFHLLQTHLCRSNYSLPQYWCRMHEDCTGRSSEHIHQHLCREKTLSRALPRIFSVVVPASTHTNAGHVSILICGLHVALCTGTVVYRACLRICLANRMLRTAD